MKEKTKELIRTYSLIILGTFIMSIGFVVFISPLKLAPGGVYGIAIILHHVFNFPIGLSGSSRCRRSSPCGRRFTATHR